MEYVEVQGARVPALGFGTFRMTGSECAQAVEQAIQTGYRHIDTAEIYENEKSVGEGIRAAGVRREELFITTKAWIDDLSRSGVRKSLEGSLCRLDTDYVDLWLIHWPNPAFPLEETLQTMMQLRETGRVRHIGVSNFPVASVEEAVKVAPIVCNQVEYHPYLSQEPILTHASKHHMMITAYAPIAMGKVAGDPLLVRIGERYGKSPVQVALRWLIQQPNVSAIPKAADPKHCVENIDIFDFSLNDEEMAAVFGLARGKRLINPELAPQWDV